MDNHFMEYNDILNKINEVQTKIIELKESIYSVKGVSYDDVPKGTGKNIDIVYFLAEIEELEIELMALNSKKAMLKKKHEEEIDKLKNCNYKSLLRMYYIYKFDKYKIADTMNISVGHFHRLKREAISDFLTSIINEYQ